jgi:hypothetical protein
MNPYHSEEITCGHSDELACRGRESALLHVDSPSIFVEDNP